MLAEIFLKHLSELLGRVNLVSTVDYLFEPVVYRWLYWAFFVFVWSKEGRMVLVTDRFVE